MTPAQLAVLAAEVADTAYDGMSEQQIADVLNASDRDGPIPAADIRRYLRAVGALPDIEVIARFGHEDAGKVRAAVAILGALQDFDSFDLSIAAYAAAVDRDLDACIAAGLLSSDHKAALLGLAANRQTRAGQLGLGLVTVGDVEAAELLA